MTVRPGEAVEASGELRSFAEENGINNKIAYRAALCMEEMVAYVKADEDAVRETGKKAREERRIPIHTEYELYEIHLQRKLTVRASDLKRSIQSSIPIISWMYWNGS